MRTLVDAARRVESRGRRLRDPRRPVRAGLRPLPRAGRRARRRPADRLAAPRRPLHREAGHPGHQRRRPDRRRRPDQGRRRAARSATRRPSTTAWCRAPTAASSGSTSCPTWPSGSRSRCSTCWRSATSRSAATRCGCRWTCSWSPPPTRRTTPTAAGSSPRSRTGSAPRSGPTTSIELTDEVALIRQEADLVAEVRRPPARGARPVQPRAARVVVGRPALRRLGPVRHRRRRGASPASALRRAARTGERGRGRPDRRRRRGAAHAARQGRVRDGRGGPRARRLGHLLRLATAATFRERLAGLDLSGFTAAVRRGRRSWRPASWCRPPSCWPSSGTVPGLAKVLDRLGYGDAAGRGQVAAAVEFVLEGLHLTRRIAKEHVDGRTVYGS